MKNLDPLIADGLLERVPADRGAAVERLQEAQRHLASAAVISGPDPDGAYALVWDAARKAIVAHMLTTGYRAKADRPGAHRAVVLYAEAELGVDEHVASLDRMRRTRNRSEYGSRTITTSEVRSDAKHVEAVVRKVGEALQ